MLKRILIICGLVTCGFMSVQAMEEEKDLTPGVLVCNGQENKCLRSSENEGESTPEDSLSAIRFAVFSEDKEDEANLLACRNCL